MTPTMRTRALSLPAQRTLVVACCTALSSMCHLQAFAQDATQPPAAAEVPPRAGIWVEPRVTVGATLTNNGTLASTNPQSEQVLEVSPGVRAILNKPRAKGFFDYSLTSLYHAQGTSGDNFRNALNANMTFEAVDNTVFLDASGIMSDEVISAFGTQSSGRSDINRASTASFRLSPYVRGTLGGRVNYELRYSAEALDTDAAVRSDITVQSLSVRMRSELTGQSLGWSFDASTQDAEYSLGRRTRSDTVQGGLLYALNPQVLVTVTAGVEANDVITLTRESYNTAGLNFDWRPSDRTRLQAGIQRRYFGTGHNVSFEHRTGRTVWRYTDTRDVVNSPLESADASLGSIYGLLDSLYTSQEPDPIRRAQLVEAELVRLGLPPDARVFQSFLSSSATLDRSQQLSVALVGQRDVITLSLGRGDSRRLDPTLNLGDDFDIGGPIRQQSWGVNYAHRLTPITTYTIGLASQKNKSTVAGLDNRLTSFTLGLSTRISLRTSGSLQFQRTDYDRAIGSYGETAISAFITHRF
ncbi:TIGR03016 family PEP-CTERM system-associated outer membrane protein [Hydrogenophaga sp.]|uniref:TIGR03016 family PEP-CTERM system-associated outer membrane protein n=2 Tax=Hydrogenophaga sp. TaxID=1904254 RepID=UPI003D0A20C0